MESDVKRYPYHPNEAFSQTIAQKVHDGLGEKDSYESRMRVLFEQQHHFTQGGGDESEYRKWAEQFMRD